MRVKRYELISINKKRIIYIIIYILFLRFLTFENDSVISYTEFILVGEIFNTFFMQDKENMHWMNNIHNYIHIVFAILDIQKQFYNKLYRIYC